MKLTRSKQERFTVIDSDIARDKNLSFKAKGLLFLIMSLPPDWDFSVRGLMSISKEGKSAIYSVIEELIEFGYCERIQERTKGTFKKTSYCFFESPNRGVEPLTDFPEADNPEADFPEAENRPQLNNKKIKDLKNEELNNSLSARARAENEPVENGSQDDHTDDMFESFPLKQIFDAFPDAPFTPGQTGMILAAVKDRPADREAWANTIQIYLGNYDRALNRYLPEKVGNLLGVFKRELQKVEMLAPSGESSLIQRLKDGDPNVIVDDDFKVVEVKK